MADALGEHPREGRGAGVAELRGDGAHRHPGAQLLLCDGETPLGERWSPGDRPRTSLNRAANALRDMFDRRASDSRFQGSPGASCIATSAGASRSSASPGSRPAGGRGARCCRAFHRSSWIRTTSNMRSATRGRPQRTLSTSENSRSSAGASVATSSRGSTIVEGSVRTSGCVAPPSKSSVAHAKSDSSVGALRKVWSSGRGKNSRLGA